MTTASYVPPSVLPPLAQKFAPLLKRKWFRELVLAPPTITGRRFSNKTEDYGVFMPSRVARIAQVSIYVQDIARSTLVGDARRDDMKTTLLVAAAIALIPLAGVAQDEKTAPPVAPSANWRRAAAAEARPPPRGPAVRPCRRRPGTAGRSPRGSEAAPSWAALPSPEACPRRRRARAAAPCRRS